MNKTQKETDLSKYLESLFPNIISDICEYAIFMMDTQGNVRTWNAGCINIKEYNPEEIIGKNYDLLFPDFLRKENIPLKELEEAKNTGKYEAENWRRKKSGELFWAHVLLHRVEDENGNLVGFAKITQDLTRRKKMEDELKRVNKELHEANEDMDNFIYTASHDLKSPVNNLEGILNVFEEELTDNSLMGGNLKDLMDLMKTSITKLKETINDLSITARIEPGKHRKNSGKVNLNELLEEIQVLLLDKIKEAGVVIEADFSEVSEVNFSRKNLRSILMNLVSNAVKYRSPERKCFVKVMARNANGFVCLSVSDNGLGIKETDKGRVFLLYQRMHDHVEGTGVGLAIVSRIVDKAGGRIEIDSQEGQGSTFKVYLPE